MQIPIKTGLVPYVSALVGWAILVISGCANQSPPAPEARLSPPASAQLAADNSSALQAPGEVGPDDSSAALEALWAQRTAASTAMSGSGFALGPGDVLRISVPMIDQLKDRTVRVSENDAIALPLLGEINVAGMTEEDLRQELTIRAGRYMYNPQVEVFLKTPENRVVAVLGSVKAPGRYLVASRSDTIMTLLSRAGGITDKGSYQVLLFPAPSVTPKTSPGKPGVAYALASPAAYQLDAGNAAQAADVATDSSPPVQSAVLTDNTRGMPFIINTNGTERYLEMPVRPGDVLFVPAAGSVSVQGWVDKAGIFPITPGMTVLGSVAAAGGALFSSSATLVRPLQGGGQRQIHLDLAKIKSGQEPDVPVQGGDVIIVERSVAGAVPYSVYFLLNRVGLGLPLIW
jgi:polysaccharide biosynthesis/export protein